MTRLARLRSWIRSVSRRSRMESELDDEIRFHVDQYVADLVASGLPVSEARRRARLEFGAIDARKEECREALGLRLLDELTGDLRYAVRQLRRSPAFTTVAVLSLALGIGANAAIFSLMEAALWKSIPVRSPDQLRLFSWVSGPNRLMNGINGNLDRTPDGGATSESFSYPVFLELQRHGEDLETVFGFKPIGRVTAVIDGEPELVVAQLVSGNFYQGVGVQPVVGRAIEAADDSLESGEAVAVISHGLWSRRFGRDPAVVGKRININASPVTIVGVNPATFTGVEPGQNPDVFLPMYLQPVAWQRRGDSLFGNPDVWWVLVMGRLKPDVSESAAQARLDVILQGAASGTLPGRADRDRPHLRLLSGARGLDGLRGDFRRPLLVLFSLVAVVLLIACANVANLLLARAAVRQREISLRLALGASRWRVARQLVIEGLTLAAIGGIVGVATGYWARETIPALLATSWQPSPFHAEFGWRVVGLSAVATTVTGLTFSLVPAWRSRRIEINAALKDAGRVVPRGRRWRGSPLVVFQVCLSVLLLIGAGLFIRTLWNLTSVTLGFQPDRVLLFSIDPPRTRYPGEQRNALFQRLHETIAAIPGVDAASLSGATVLAGGSSQTGVATDLANPDRRRLAWVNEIGFDFFKTMGIPILQGRPLDRRDGVNSQAVTVVSEQFAREFFPNQNPLGKSFRNGTRVLEIVGVSADARYDRVRSPFPPTFYRSYLQEDPANLAEMTFEVRSAVSQERIVRAIREAVRSIDSDLPIFDVRTQNEQIAATMSQEQLFVTLSVMFAALAVLLACVGIYGILANSVARRTNEIGIRIALGADRRRLLVMILREAALVTVVGAAAGVGIAMALTRYIRSMLYGVEPADPLTMGAAAALMMLVALVAGWVPARRAARLEPMLALRHE